MENLIDKGFVPSDWVELLHRGLEESAAYSLEKEYLHASGGTVFNRQSGERNYQAKLTDSQAREIYVDTTPVRELAVKYGVSRSAIYHIKKGTQWRAATAFIRN
jgi:DNA invertase Pin-like site-specific DNA recombinase